MLFQRIRWAVFGTLLGRVFSLVVAQYVAWVFGANRETDAVFLALAFVVFGGELVRLSIEPVLVPELIRMAAQEPEHLSSAYSQLSRIAFIWGGIAAALLATAGLAAAIGGRHSLVSSMPGRLAQLAPAAVVLPVIAVDSAWLTARLSFFRPGAAAASGSATTLITLLAFGSLLGTTALPLGYLLGWGVTAAVLHHSARRALPVRATATHTLPLDFRSMFRRLAPVAIGASLINLNPIADRVIASWVAGAGAVTVFELSTRVHSLVVSLATTSLGSVFLVHWSEAHVKSGLSGAGTKLLSAFKFIAPILLLGTLVLYILIPVAFRLLFQHGSFTVQDVSLAITVARWLAIAVPAVVASSLLARFIYSTGDTRFALVSALVAVGINIPADLVLGYMFGLPGIAIATIINYCCIGLVAGIWIARRSRHEASS